MIDFLFNPTNRLHKSILGALEVNENCEINLYVNKNFNIYDLKIVIYNETNEIVQKSLNFKKTEDNYNVYFTVISFSKPYLYWYYFEFYDCYGKHYLGCLDNYDCYLTNENVKGYQINVYEKNNTDLSWFKGKIMYQIMVDRFNGVNVNKDKYKDYIFHDNWSDCPNYLPINGKILNNDFFGGNFRGIIDKIDYLKSLNISVIYLNPIFLAPSNHKYNTSDYLTIDPMFGTEDDFYELVTVLKENGIYLIIDGVFNHTGDDSIYFNKYNHFPQLGAYQSVDSKYYNWYKFISFPNKYESLWGIDTLPSVNQNSSFPNFICDEVVNKWCKFGIKGFRLDVVDELNDNFVRKLNHSIKMHDKNSIIIGEVWEDASNKIAYGKRKSYFDGSELDSVMNYPLKDAIIDYLKNGNGLNLVNTMRTLVNNYPKHVLDSLMNIISTHDTARIMTEFSNVNCYTLSLEERANYKLSKSEYYIARGKLKLAAILLYTLPGVPCIYYGDETGLEGYKDPFCRKTMPWNNLDEDILSFYRLLGKIRNDDVFVDGEYRKLFLTENGVFAFSRIKDSEIIIIINNSNYEYKYNIEKGYDLIDNCLITNYIIVHSQTGKIIKRINNEKNS